MSFAKPVRIVLIAFLVLLVGEVVFFFWKQNTSVLPLPGNNSNQKQEIIVPAHQQQVIDNQTTIDNQLTASAMINQFAARKLDLVNYYPHTFSSEIQLQIVLVSQDQPVKLTLVDNNDQTFIASSYGVDYQPTAKAATIILSLNPQLQQKLTGTPFDLNQQMEKTLYAALETLEANIRYAKGESNPEDYMAGVAAKSEDMLLFFTNQYQQPFIMIDQ